MSFISELLSNEEVDKALVVVAKAVVSQALSEIKTDDANKISSVLTGIQSVIEKVVSALDTSTNSSTNTKSES